MLKAGLHSARVRFRSTELPYPTSLIPRPPPSFRQKLLPHVRLVFIPLSSPSRHPVHSVLTRARMCPCMPCGPPVNPLHIRSTHSTHERSVSVRRRTLSLSRIRSRAAHPMESGSFKYSSQFHEYAGQTVPRRRCNRPTANGRRTGRCHTVRFVSGRASESAGRTRSARCSRSTRWCVRLSIPYPVGAAAASLPPLRACEHRRNARVDGDSLCGRPSGSTGQHECPRVLTYGSGNPAGPGSRRLRSCRVQHVRWCDGGRHGCGGHGQVSGAGCKEFLMDSRLPGKQLHLIWELADTDKAGRCNSHSPLGCSLRRVSSRRTASTALLTKRPKSHQRRCCVAVTAGRASRFGRVCGVHA